MGEAVFDLRFGAEADLGAAEVGFAVPGPEKFIGLVEGRLPLF